MKIAGLNIKIDRELLINCLRLIVFYAILSHYFINITNLPSYFRDSAHRRAKQCFLFVQPTASSGESYVYDFITFYAGGRLNLERIEKNRPIDLYNPYLFTQALERVSAPLKPQGTYCLQYPPMFFALVTPLAYFNLYTAWRIWIFGIALCVSLTYLFIAFNELKARPLLLIGLLICFTTLPVFENFTLGQTTAIEAALIALSFRFIIDKKYFWAGIIAAGAVLKLQQMLILLIPGFCVGREKFSRGFFLMVGIEALLSVFVVGHYNMFNFIRANYMSEVTHSFSDMNDVWYYLVFSGMLYCLPWFISNADKIGEIAYGLVILFSLILWLKAYPALQKVSNHAVELMGALTTIPMIMFSLHGYLYDYVIYIIPCLWLYIWSTTNEANYSRAQSIIRFIISVIIFYVPFFFWDNLVLQLAPESTITLSQIRIFSLGLVLTTLALIAIFIEFRKHPRETLIEIQ
jgi:hypothetical protein